MKDITVWQWDLNRALPSGAQAVHFAPVVGDEGTALVVPVEDGKAYIPNSLLQAGVDLYAWATVDGVTVDSCRVHVTPRTMPDSYEYSETHTATFESLTKEVSDAIAALESAKIKDVVANAIAAGEPASATFVDGTLTLSIPAGDIGPQGLKGDKGDKGDSPTDEHLNALIDAKLGVIVDGSY